ncbi:MAG: glycosyl hydrolase, partial [Thermoguttaceae bacterium]
MMNCKIIRIVVLLVLLVGLLDRWEIVGAADRLEQGFLAPPHSARPWVYWFWLNGNITKQGITADLEAMQQVGMGGALWMWGGGLGGETKEPVKFLGPKWWELMRHTIQEADRLGLRINLTNGSGWSHSGGPWVKPQHSMQRLELMREVRLQGPRHWEIAFGQDDALVGVLAYAVKGRGKESMLAAGVKVTAGSTQPGFDIANALDGDAATRWISHGTRPGEGPTKAQPESVLFAFPQPYSAASLYIVPFKDCGPRECVLQTSNDGKEYETVCHFEMVPETAKTVPFEAVASRFFRLQITSSHPFQGQEAWNVQIAEVRLLGKGEKPLPLNKSEILDSRSVVNFTDKVDRASRRLVWEVPPGTWTVQVLGHGSTGDRPHPITQDEGGWECDKLSPEAVQENWRGFVLRVLNECGPAARRVIGWTHVDSYEFGAQTWTPKFRAEFQRRCEYDPLPYLPTVLGGVVDSPEVSARFLWDFRRVRADLFAEGIGGHFRDLCRSEGVALTTEPHLVPDVFDQIQYGGHVLEPVGNFLAERRTHWYAENPPIGPEVHLAKGEASAAYTYGLNGVVWAEAFTGVDHAHAWKESPDYLRTWGDLWLTEGINRFAFHCWAHSPSLTQRPGNTLGPWGIHFDRRNTWFDLATGYISCLTRCQFMLQQGLPIIDVCMFTGDGITAEFPRHPELRAAGYDYHGLTNEVLRGAKVENGGIILPSRMRYRLLVTYNREMRPETIRKLREMVKAGATVMGLKPEDAPGLVGYPASRGEARKIADELWGSDAVAGRKGRVYGRGHVFWGDPERSASSTAGCGVAAYLSCAREIEVLREIGTPPDFEYSMSGKENCDNMLAYAHRRVGETDLYFVSNQAGRVRKEDCTFRSTGRQPELWNAVTGEIRNLPAYRLQNGRTIVPLEFAPGQSIFVVFRQPAREGPKAGSGKNFDDVKPIADLAGPWLVSFDPHWGGPDRPVTFDKLDNWAERPQERIKHYSGKATYRRTFDFPVDLNGRRVYLDLGRVKELAEVRINGQRLGTVW